MFTDVLLHAQVKMFRNIFNFDENLSFFSATDQLLQPAKRSRKINKYVYIALPNDYFRSNFTKPL